MKDLTKAIIRLVVTAVLMINAALTAKGINPIPFDEALVTEWLTYAASGLSAIWAWWKNNNITEAAKEGQEVTNLIKAGDMVVTGYEDECKEEE